MICGTPDPLPVTMRHVSGFSGPDRAKDYMDLFGGHWDDTPGAIEFVRWLHTHPEVMAERAAIQECDQELLWERDPGNRRSIIDQRDILAHAINGSLSDRIVAKRANRDGNEVCPWHHAAACPVIGLQQGAPTDDGPMFRSARSLSDGVAVLRVLGRNSVQHADRSVPP